MKKWILVLVLLFLPTFVVASTAKYPVKLNNENQFTKYKHFNNMYFNIYEDTNREDLDELIMRALDSDEFTMEERAKMGQGLPALEAIYKNASQAKQKSESERIQQRIEFEQQLLRQENDIKRQASLLGIFYNGNHEKDAPFDLVRDLNHIDKAFVGEKATEPDPAYTHIKQEDKSSIAPADRETLGSVDLEEESAFKQRTDSLPAVSPYDESDGSIAGSLENIIHESWKKLDAVALAVENQSRNIFHPAHQYGVPIPAFPMPGMSSQPPENTEETDSEKIKQNLAAENIMSRIKQVFTQDSSTGLATENSETMSQKDRLAWISGDIKAKQENLKLFLDMWDWISLNGHEEQRYTQMNLSLDQLNEFLESFRDESKTLLQWSKTLANKPAL